MKMTRYRLPWRAVIAFACLFGLVGCSNSNSADTNTGSGQPGSGRGGSRGGGSRSMDFEGEQAVSVKAHRASRRDVSTYLISNTTLESVRQITVAAKVDAIIKQILVEEGSRVREGDVLARLDETEIRNEHTQARIAVDQADLNVTQTEIKARQSEANEARAKSLFEQKLISKEEYDQSVLSSRTDALGTRVATQQLETAKARLEAAEIKLAYAQIRTPITGVITQRLVEVGDRVNPNQVVFSVEDFSPLWARIFIPQRSLTEVSVGQAARLRVEAVPDREFRGVVKMIHPVVNADSGTVKVTLEITEGLNVLRPGMFGTTYIATRTHANAVVIPKKAILRERDENRVFVVKTDQTVEKRVVKLGFSEEEWVEVATGLDADEVVVTVGYEGLDDAYAVNILGWEGEAPPPTDPLMAGRAVERPPVAGQPGREVTGDSVSAGPARGRGRGFDPERAKGFVMSNPEAKKEYEARVSADPALEADPERLREFMTELLRKYGGGRRGRS